MMSNNDIRNTDEQTRVLQAGGFEKIISPGNKAVWEMARHMRIRPEAVHQMLSDAFDKSLADGTMLVSDASLLFESPAATVTLVPQVGRREWKLEYKGNESMYCKEICRHPDEAFTMPETLTGRVVFPEHTLRHLISLADNLSGPPSVDLFDKLNRDYHRALREDTFSYDADRRIVTFKTQFWTQDGQQIFAAIEPHYYEPIPDTWRISRFWRADRVEKDFELAEGGNGCEKLEA